MMTDAGIAFTTMASCFVVFLIVAPLFVDRTH